MSMLGQPRRRYINIDITMAKKISGGRFKQRFFTKNTHFVTIGK